ncbi:MAG: phosphate ABC transporter ATP-binding protein [Anaerolineales bacterium]|nr:phosphate ABC transporter ATP-binding protein [Anaerolineales bacterium]
MDDLPSGVKIKVRNLDFYYDQFQALIDVSMDIRSEDITALIGPSGCGKSTFLRCLNRMNDTIQGARVEGLVKIDGEDIYANGVDLIDLRRRVGMVFQKPNPFPKSIYDNVAFGPRVLGIANRQEVEELVIESLHAVALWDEVNDKLGSSAFDLSLGEQQRLCLARVLAVRPEIILMDEPCSALDPIATLWIEELMRSLQDRYTFVIVTHNMQQAARVSDKTGLFWLGELVEFGETDQIFTRPENQQTEDYITGRLG